MKPNQASWSSVYCETSLSSSWQLQHFRKSVLTLHFLVSCVTISAFTILLSTFNSKLVLVNFEPEWILARTELPHKPAIQCDLDSLSNLTVVTETVSPIVVKLLTAVGESGETVGDTRQFICY